MGFTNLLFDADDTLLDFRQAEHAAFFGLFDALGLSATESLYQLYSSTNAALWQDFNAGRISHAQIRQARFPQFFAAAGLQLNTAACEQLYDGCMCRLGTFLMPHAEEVCRRLSADHALYIITNATSRTHNARLAGSAIAPYIRRPFVSEDEGFSKPDAAYFDAVLREIPGAHRQNTLVIGDSLTADIQGANNAGLPCCWYNPTHAPKPADLRIDFEIHDLRELLPLV